MWGQIAAAGVGALGSYLGGKEGNQDNFGWGNQWADDHNQMVKNQVQHYANLPTQQFFGGNPVATMDPDRLRALQAQYNFGKQGVHEQLKLHYQVSFCAQLAEFQMVN